MKTSNLRIVIVHRRTRLQELVARHNTLEQARFYVESLGGDLQDYIAEDRVYRRVIDEAESVLKFWGRILRLEREFLPNYLFGEDDLVVVIGQDGLVANTLKYLSSQQVVAVNPDPQRYEGVLLPFSPSDLAPIVRDVVAGRRKQASITLAEASLNDGQSLLAVNDFFIGPKRHTTAAYTVSFAGEDEFQMSSGVIVSTGLGSTGWLRSIVTGAFGLSSVLGGPSDGGAALSKMAWDSRFLLFAIREPYPAVQEQPTVFGRIDAEHRFTMTSAMAEDGVIFSDGMVDDAIPFNTGARVDVHVCRHSVQLVL